MLDLAACFLLLCVAVLLCRCFLACLDALFLLFWGRPEPQYTARRKMPFTQVSSYSAASASITQQVLVVGGDLAASRGFLLSSSRLTLSHSQQPTPSGRGAVVECYCGCCPRPELEQRDWLAITLLWPARSAAARLLAFLAARLIPRPAAPPAQAPQSPHLASSCVRAAAAAIAQYYVLLTGGGGLSAVPLSRRPEG